MVERAGIVDISGGRWHGGWWDDGAGSGWTAWRGRSPHGGPRALVSGVSQWTSRYRPRHGGGSRGYDDGSLLSCKKRLMCGSGGFGVLREGRSLLQLHTEPAGAVYPHRHGSSTPERAKLAIVTCHHPSCRTRRPLVDSVHSDQRGPAMERISASPGERSRVSQSLGRRAWGGWRREELARSASRPGKPPHMATTGGVRKEVRSPTGRDDRWNGCVWRFASLEGRLQAHGHRPMTGGGGGGTRQGRRVLLDRWGATCEDT